MSRLGDFHCHRSSSLGSRGIRGFLQGLTNHSDVLCKDTTHHLLILNFLSKQPHVTLFGSYHPSHLLKRRPHPAIDGTTGSLSRNLQYMSKQASESKTA